MYVWVCTRLSKTRGNINSHETLRSDQIGLSEFTYEMQEAFKSGDSLEYINVALCGHLSQDNKPYCVVLNARMGLHPPACPTFTRDFDSAIGVTCNLPFTAAFDVFPVPPFRYTLKKSNHVLGPIYPAVSSFNHSVPVSSD